MRGKNINLFLMDESPTGRIKCTIANWTGVAYRIPRTDLEKCKDRNDLSQSGVYFLFGIEEESGANVVYIGQAGVRKNGEGVLMRLQEHKRNADKDYWTEAIVFTTSNNSFGPTDISWLEHRFCSLAVSANRYIVKNGNDPNVGNVTEEKQSELEEFADYAKTIMGILGHKLFEPVAVKATDSASTDEQLLFCKVSSTDAKGKATSDGFVVFAGSKVRLSLSDLCRESVRRLREKYAQSLNTEGVMLRDILFNSPSEAASFLVGQSRNGLTSWKTAEGKTLKELESEEAN